MRPFLPLRSILSAVGLALGSATAHAQVSRLYATDGDGPKGIYVLQGGVVVNQFTPTTNNGAYALAVGSTIHTLGSSSNIFGQEYTLGGVPIGAPYPNTAVATGCCLWDGTTDGTYNYASGIYDRQVWRGGLDWSNLTPLFTVGYDAVGITYDRVTNSLWLGEFNGNGSSIFQHALDGTLMSSFTPTLPRGTSGITALAYDSADESLWFSNADGLGTIYQYSRSGTQLGTATFTGEHMGMFVGAEFAFTATPEPGTFALFGTSLIGLLCLVHRRGHRTGPPPRNHGR